MSAAGKRITVIVAVGSPAASVELVKEATA